MWICQEVNQRKSCSKKLNKYVAVFDYIYQALNVLITFTVSFTSIIGAPVAIESASFTLIYIINTINIINT